MSSRFIGSSSLDVTQFLHNIHPDPSTEEAWKSTKHAFRKAVHGAKWQNFAAGIGTGATYTTLHGLHWHPHWLTIVEVVLFLINVVIFTVNLLLILIKTAANLRAGNISQHILNASTPVLLPLVVLDYGTICIGITLYAEQFGSIESFAFSALFWSYLAFTVIVCSSMTFLWFGFGKSFNLRSFAMTGAFLIYPVMLVGTIAFNTLRMLDPSHPDALAILLLGYICQGLGFSVAFIFITVHFYRSIRYGFHRGAAANSTFIACGPPGFTALSLLQLGSYGRKIIPLHTPLPQEAADVFYYASIPVALCLLGFAIYCWIFAMFPYLLTFTKHIALNPAAAWPLTFPTSGFILTLSTFGTIFDSHAFYYIQAVFVGYICIVWIILLPTWLYRLCIPPDPKLLMARAKYFEDAYDHVNFWSTVRMADQAEHEFNAGTRRVANELDTAHTQV